jgi:hypothetical protein
MSTETILSKAPSYWAADLITVLVITLIILMFMLIFVMKRENKKSALKPKDGFYKGRIGTTRFRYPADDDND